MKKIVCLFIILVSCSTLWAQEKASSVTLSYGTTYSDTYTTVGCNLPYSWNGIDCDQTSLYIKVLTNKQGYDSIARLHLTVEDWTNYETIDMAICPAEFPYHWTSTKSDVNNVTDLACNEVGTYVRHFINDKECDSTVVLNIMLETEGCCPAGTINGLFTVNNQGKQVYFAKGNLQYLATKNGVWGDTTHAVVGGTANGVFRFAENQYDYIGNAPGNNVKSDSKRQLATSWIDLFGYGSSGVSSSCQPYVETTGQVYPTSDIAGTNHDWGVYNAISNGGNTPNLWRTLKKSEWVYLLSTRKVQTNKTGWARATVCGVYGIIILPDDWNEDYPATRGTSSQWTSNVFNATTTTTWLDVQKKGVIFLPVAGYKDGQTIYSVGSVGHYHSSTDTQGNLYWFKFNSSDLDPDHSESGHNENAAISVRLVQDYVPQQ